MSQIIDLIKNNFDDALNAATRNNSDLVNVIEREKLLVSKITRPGNLYDYLDKIEF